jgi:hypothetical protein
LVAGLGFLAAFFPDAIAPASISDRVRRRHRLLCSVFFPQKKQKQKKTRRFYVLLTLVSFFSYYVTHHCETKCTAFDRSNASPRSAWVRAPGCSTRTPRARHQHSASSGWRKI